MKTLYVSLFVLTALALGLDGSAQAQGQTCFAAGSTTSGLNRICFYNCPSGQASITVSAASICPISIRR